MFFLVIKEEAVYPTAFFVFQCPVLPFAACLPPLTDPKGKITATLLPRQP